MRNWIRLVVAASIGLSPTGAVAQPETGIVKQARAAVVRYRLADRPDCVSYEVTRNVHPMVDEVTVREVHNRRCGGDPQVAPRVATLRIDQRHHVIAQYDAVDDRFKLLK